MKLMFLQLFAVSAVFLSGCISPRLYPSDWASRAKSDSACYDISGKYKPISLPLPNSMQCDKANIFKLLFFEEVSCISLPTELGAVYGSATQNSWIEIKQQTDKINITYHVPKDELAELLKKPFTKGIWPGTIDENGNGALERIKLLGKDYVCTSSGIELILNNDWMNANIGATKNVRHRKYLKANDGSLVLDASDFEYGFIWLPPLPLAAYVNRWVMWPIQK